LLSLHGQQYVWPLQQLYWINRRKQMKLVTGQLWLCTLAVDSRLTLVGWEDGGSSKLPHSLKHKLRVQGVQSKIPPFTRSHQKNVAEMPSSWYSCAIEDQRIEASFYSLSCIHTQDCIHNQVYSPATLCLWFPSRAALKLCFINSCTMVPTHSCAMNNSYSQTEKKRAQNKYQRRQGGFWPQALCICLCFSLFVPHSVSFCLICVCLLLLRTVSLVLLCCVNLMLFTIVSIVAILLSLQTKSFGFFSRSHSLTADEYCLSPVLSCCLAAR